MGAPCRCGADGTGDVCRAGGDVRNLITEGVLRVPLTTIMQSAQQDMTRDLDVPKVSLGRWEGRAVCLPVKTGDKSGDKSDNDWCRRPIRSNRDIWATR